VLDLFGGALVPLSLVPGWLRGIVLVLPFQGLAYTPISIYIGTIQGEAIWWALLHQLVWSAVLLGLTRLLWLRGFKRIVIQGG
jgi:ABC-2 type transport system permease protein